MRSGVGGRRMSAGELDVLVGWSKDGLLEPRTSLTACLRLSKLILNDGY